MSNWYQNGGAVDTLSVDDRAVQYGDGLFETIAVRDGRPRFWDYHMERLQQGCARLGLNPPVVSLLERDVEKAIARARSGIAHCIVKIVVTAGESERGYQRAAAANCTTLVGVFPSRPLPTAHYRDGVRLQLCESRVSLQPGVAGLKTLNRLDQVLARREWDSDSVFDGLMCDPRERLICTTRCNVFLVKNNKLLSPALEYAGVAGVMRRHILALLRSNNIECEVQHVPLDELGAADEVFVCNSQVGIVPVAACGDQAWAVGDATKSVMSLLAYNSVPECAP